MNQLITNLPSDHTIFDYIFCDHEKLSLCMTCRFFCLYFKKIKTRKCHIAHECDEYSSPLCRLLKVNHENPFTLQNNCSIKDLKLWFTARRPENVNFLFPLERYLFYAAIFGDTELIKYLSYNNLAIDSGTANICIDKLISNDRYETFCTVIKRNFFSHCEFEISYETIECDIKYFRYLLDNNIKCPPFLLQRLAYDGEYAKLNLAIKKGYGITTQILYSVIHNGSISFLKYLLQLFPDKELLSPRLCACACIKDDILILKYLRRIIKCPWDYNALENAVIFKSMKCFLYVMTREHQRLLNILDIAIAWGNVEALHYFIRVGYNSNNDLMEIAARSCQFDCIKYLHEHGWSWPIDTMKLICYHRCNFKDDTEENKFNCFKYAHENGAPWESFNECHYTISSKYIEYAKNNGYNFTYD